MRGGLGVAHVQPWLTVWVLFWTGFGGFLLGLLFPVAFGGV